MKTESRSIRYAVVGLGRIAQTSVLPAFRRTKDSKLVALISSDPKKLEKLAAKYAVEYTGNYSELESILERAEVDAVYLALPNALHHEYTIRAAEVGVHVLCEKPLALDADECLEMIEAAEDNGVKLMTAYRLHFEPANLDAIEIAASGKLGDLRFFNSAFSVPVLDPSNIRLSEEMGGGPLYDLGVYAINAARYIFQAEPTEAISVSGNNGDPRFYEVDEMAMGTLKFPEERLASFTVSFNGKGTSYYEVVGTEGKLRLESAYSQSGEIVSYLSVNGTRKKKTFKQKDQFATEIDYFSNCILTDQPVEPSGKEGLADIEIIQALYESAHLGEKILLNLERKELRPRRSLKTPPTPTEVPRDIYLSR